MNPDELKLFKSMKTPQDVASFLGIKLGKLTYILYRLPESSKYSVFYINKKGGGRREISAPENAIKSMQRKINIMLQYIYDSPNPVHGFIPKKVKGEVRNIVSNASLHTKKKYVFNIDLKDFFPSINFGRVRGMFLANPFLFPSPVATLLAQVVTINNKLPQGAPTSPAISNIICIKMDKQLNEYAAINKCKYTRYADDLTFSTSLRAFPENLATIEYNIIAVNENLNSIITSNGFKINQQKVRLARHYQHQEVTGLTVNQFVNVSRKYKRQIRAMINALEKYGTAKCEEEYYAKYNKTYRNPAYKKPSYLDVVCGKLKFLKMVRKTNGDKDRINIYKILLNKYNTVKNVPYDLKAEKPLVITEGKTDWMHIKAALSSVIEGNRFNDFELLEYKGIMGDIALLDRCKKYAKINNKRIVICLFDRDNQDILSKVTIQGSNYKHWGSNVFSFVLPMPSHRAEGNVNIEMYYKDEEIKRESIRKQRLFLKNEFGREGFHLIDHDIICKKGLAGSCLIIDNEVYHRNGAKLSMSKTEFAENVLDKEHNFDDFDFAEFGKIFSVISEIVEFVNITSKEIKVHHEPIIAKEEA